jgi:serine/threonine-protein phosphatase 2A activator
MIKMYNVEVLSKFPVVQHFPFGSIFRWVRNPDAPMPVVSTHTASQPYLRHQNGLARVPTGVRPAAGGAATALPRTAGPTHTTNTLPGPTNSWTGQPGAMGLPATRAPWVNATSGASPLPSEGGSGAPWARGGHAGKPVDGRLSEVDESSSGPP